MRSLVQVWREWISLDDATPIFEWPKVVSVLSVDHSEEARIEIPYAKAAEVYGIKHRRLHRLRRVDHSKNMRASNGQSRYAANS